MEKEHQRESQEKDLGPSQNKDFARLLDEHLRAGYQALYVHTSEESRVEVEITRVAKHLGMGVTTWDCYEGFSTSGLRGNVKYKNAINALEALNDENLFQGKQVFIFRDLDDFMVDTNVRRRLRTLTEGNRLVSSKWTRPIIIVSPKLQIHEKLKANIAVVDFNLPDEDNLSRVVEFVRRSIESKDPDKAKCNEELHDKLVTNLLGLTANEAENCLARCLVRHSGFTEDMISTIKDEKAAIVRKSEVLTYIPEGMIASQNEIGGFDQYLTWLNRRKKAYSPAARALNIDFPKGVVLMGVPGCVADDTIVYYKRGQRGSLRPLSIHDFYGKFNNLAESGGCFGAPWQPDIATYFQSFDAETGKLVYNQVLGVYNKGQRSCVKITTDNGDSVTLTEDHPLLDDTGHFVPADALEIGQRLTVRRSLLPGSGERPQQVRRPRVIVEGLKFYPHGWTKKITNPRTGVTCRYKRAHRARLVLEARMNGLSYDEFVKILNTDAERTVTLVYLDPSLEVHHQDEDPSNDAVENLIVMTKASCEQAYCAEAQGFDMDHTQQVTITDISDVGMRQTYDVEMARPRNNFVVNAGIIVHNTGKSMVGKATCNLLGLPGYILDIGSLFGSMVGESEQRTRDVLKQVDAQKGCVLLIDEADKALGNAHDSQGDSGVTRRVFGTILTWLAENESKTFCIMTLNRTKGLPPELLRAGRFDALWYTDLPHDAERRQIMEIHLRKRGVDLEAMELADADWKEIISKTNGFVGAEIEEVVREARYISFERRQAGDPTFDELVEAAGSIVPLSQRDKEGVEEIRAFCKDKAKPVTTPIASRRGRAHRTVDLTK